MTNKIKCVEYIPPNGDIGEVEFPMDNLQDGDYPQEIFDKAQQMIDAGYNFAAELLRATQTVALYVVHDGDEVDVIIIICNPDEINAAFMSMIVQFNFDEAAKIREASNE